MQRLICKALAIPGWSRGNRRHCVGYATTLRTLHADTPSTNGSFYTCLFAARGHDLRRLLREGASDEAIESVIRSVWLRRNDRYSETRASATVDLPKIEMSYIGG